MSADDDKVVRLDGSPLPKRGEPNRALIGVLENMLERARNGELQSFIGTGFTDEGLRITAWADAHPNVCEMLGAIAWMHEEYVAKHAEALR